MVWYGMVWCGGAGQFFRRENLYIEVREIDFSKELKQELSLLGKDCYGY